MGRKAKVYDEEEIIRLYKKYGSVQDVRLRLSISCSNIKKILESNGFEITKGANKRKDFKFVKNI